MFGTGRFRLEFRRSRNVDRVGNNVIVIHQIGRGGDLGPVLGFQIDFEIRGLVGIDFGDFRLGLGRRLAGGFDGSAQRIKNAGIAGQGFELLDPGAGLVRHEVFEIKADFFDRLGDLGIAGSIGLGFAFDGGRQFRGRSGLVDGKGMLPLGGKVGGKVGGEIVRVCVRVHRQFLDGEFRMRGRGHRPGRGRSRSGSRGAAHRRRGDR